MDTLNLIKQLKQGDKKVLARCITIVENELDGYEELLTNITTDSNTPVIGITGPPGAGKSTLINGLITTLNKSGKKTGVIVVDPTSPFTNGSLLGDRIRMSEHFNNPNVYIRSLAARGSLGGLSAKAIEVCDVMKSFNFDYIFIETVGVGQSEVEIAGLADTTVLVLVPEAGDEVQTLKSGIMEIADIFVVNKADRDGAKTFMKDIRQLLHLKKSGNWVPPVISCVASRGEGIEKVIESFTEHQKLTVNNRKFFLLAEKAYQLVQNKRMADISKAIIQQKIEAEIKKGKFNLYQFVREIV